MNAVTPLILAAAGLLTAIGGVLVPLVITRWKIDAERAADLSPVEQGQPVGPSRVEIERSAYRAALNRANDRLAQRGLPLEHPNFDVEE